jgi:glycosylphosphatidylinositol phospholipase D
VRSFRWTRGGETVYFDAPGGSSSSARAVSADGSVVVGDFVVFGEPGTVAYIWTADTGARPLSEVLVDEFGLGAALAGWKLQTASDISGDGRVIAGTGVNPDGCLQTYVVRLPGGCEADITGDGELDIFDFLAFQNLFDDGDARADFDGDGNLTIFDFLAFQSEFELGCG